MSRTASASSNNVFGERLVRNLRDLQLDDELDFPDVEAQTFDIKDSVHNQAQRIRKAEWVLFQLLQLWDPAGTKDLSRYHPAYEPKQSLELRGAIFQHLSVLKKDGVLPKELILRKTMFDECKGPRFEELLAVLSTAVLIKILEQDTKDVSVVRDLLLNERSDDQARLQALETSYQASLSSLLNDRNNLKRRWQRFGRVLKVKEDEIKQRRREHELIVGDSRQPRIPKRRLDRLQAHIERDWATSNEWRSVLIKSDQHLPDKSLLERPYDEVWRHASDDSLYHFRPEKMRSSLQRLEYHVDKQNQRIGKWRETKKLLDLVASPPPTEAQKVQPRVDQAAERSASPELGTTAYEQKHEGARKQSDSEDRSPPRPATAQRRSNHRSQLTLVTADFDRLDLLKESSPAPASKASTPEKSTQAPPSALQKARRRRSNTVLYSPQVSMGSRSPMDKLREDREQQDDYFDDSSLDMEQDATNIINSVLHTEPSPIKPQTSTRPLSLTERARLSMASHNTGNNNSSAHSRARSNSPAKQAEASSYQPRDRPLSLALDERTRQSLSIIAASMAPPPLPPPGGGGGSSTSPSSSRPTTSRRVAVTKRSSRSPEKRQRLPRPETPELTHVDESFLAADIDEDTIFMSRPRIAHSPPLNPTEAGDDEEDVSISMMDVRDDESVEDFS